MTERRTATPFERPMCGVAVRLAFGKTPAALLLARTREFDDAFRREIDRPAKSRS